MKISIEHITEYRYALPVELGQHRLLIRPIEGHDVQIRASRLVIQPAHSVRWIHDYFDNSIALVDFQRQSDLVRIESSVTVEQFNLNPFDFVLEERAQTLPFQYSEEELIDLAPYLRLRHPEAEADVRSWLRPFLDLNGRAKTLNFLTALNKRVLMQFQYTRRDEQGVQSPGETLRKRSGSCRDFALLMMEAARVMGLAARFVSGYICPEGEGQNHAASSATHAWLQVYLPGAGWKGFDPTFGMLEAAFHVRVGVARDPAQASPVSGTFVGPTNAHTGLYVSVDARVVDRG